MLLLLVYLAALASHSRLCRQLIQSTVQNGMPSVLSPEVVPLRIAQVKHFERAG